MEAAGAVIGNLTVSAGGELVGPGEATGDVTDHGLVSGALFLIVGMIYNRYHTRDIRQLSGLASAMPTMAFFLMLFTMAADTSSCPAARAIS